MDKYYLGIKQTKQERFLEIDNTLNANTAHYKKLLYELVEVTDDIQNNKRLCDYHLEKLYEGMQESWEYVCRWHSGYYVSWMSEDFEECKELLIRLWHSKKAQIRQRAIAILDSNTSEDVVRQILQESKNDRSKWVRSSIVGFIQERNYKQYLGDLKVRLAEEQNEMVKEAIQEVIFWLENDYFIKPFGEGQYLIYNRVKNGIRGKVVTEKEIPFYTSPEYIRKVYNGEIL